MRNYGLKILALLLTVALTVGGFTFSASAEVGTENMLQNPTWTAVEGETVGWSISGRTEKTWEQIIKTDDQGPTQDAYLNLSNCENIYISTSGYRVDFSAEGNAYITFYYKSTIADAARCYITGYYWDDAQSKYIGGLETKLNLPSTDGKWKFYKYIYDPLFTPELTHATLSFRSMISDPDLCFACPSFYVGAPEVTILNGDFEDGTDTTPDNWGINGTSAGDSLTYETDENTGNKYIKIVNDSSGLPYYSQNTAELVYDQRYRVTFKFMPTTSTDKPRVDISTVTAAGYTVAENKSFDNFCSGLGTLTPSKWTEYVGYITVTGERANGDARDGKAAKLQILLRCPASSTACYDDITVEKESSKMIISQDGCEIDYLTANKPITALYHHTDSTSVTYLAAIYQYIGDTKSLVEIKSVEATNEADARLEMNIPASVAGSRYSFVTFVWSNLTGIVPCMSRLSALEK